MKREEQYARKAEYVFFCVERMRMPECERDVFALFYLIHTAVEAAMDIAAMLVKDLGFTPKDDYENIQTLRSVGVIGAGLAEDLGKLNGLRNVLVHRYNKIDEQLVIESLEDIKRILKGFVEAAENALRTVL